VAFQAALSVDVEDWFHILDSAATPALHEWERLESRVAHNMEPLLELFEQSGVMVTLFWLGWIAERHKGLLRRCVQAGHEIASHGYAHLLAYQVGPRKFYEDIRRARLLLEDLTGARVLGFRAPGFGITERAPWAFGEIRRAGYMYDSSVFPAARGHGGLVNGRLEPHWMNTPAGPLAELPISVVQLAGQRICLFGGGYLRAAPLPLIRWGVRQLQREARPLIVYIHPRDTDPHQPRLALPLRRRVKCYANLCSTLPKLRWMTRTIECITMSNLAHLHLAAPDTCLL